MVAPTPKNPFGSYMSMKQFLVIIREANCNKLLRSILLLINLLAETVLLSATNFFHILAHCFLHGFESLYTSPFCNKFNLCRSYQMEIKISKKEYHKITTSYFLLCFRVVGKPTTQ
jgi:hypothetical protein